MRDPYTVLGLKPGASDKDIKSAFRKLAKVHHPDQNTNDPKAQERFAEINQAYEILGDADKRAQFDRGEIDAEGKPRFQAHGFEDMTGFAGRARGGAQPGGASFRFATSGDVGGIDEILSELMGGATGRGRRRGSGSGASGFEFAGERQGANAAAAQGRDVTLTARVSLEDLVHTRKARVTLPNGKMVDVSIPAGTLGGEKLRLKGHGQASPLGGPSGDAFVEFVLKTHRLFAIDGDDLKLDLPISLDEAVLGAKIRVPTLDGPVDLKIPSGTSGGAVMRLKGKGLPNKSAGRGDLLVRIQIALPKPMDTELEALMTRWREMGRENPRGVDYA